MAPQVGSMEESRDKGAQEEDSCEQRWGRCKCWAVSLMGGGKRDASHRKPLQEDWKVCGGGWGNELGFEQAELLWR